MRMTRVRFPESASTSRATVRSQAALVVSVMARLRAASGGRVCAGVVVLPWYCAKFFQRDVYVRDSVGRVTGVVDRVRRTPEGSYGVRDVAQCYGYDVHNRLERAWTVNAVSVDAEDACVTAPTAQGQWLVDATAFDASWEYELAGQVASSSQSWVGSGGVMSQVLEYVYDGGAPHAVTSTGVGQYEYDGAGRMIARDADGAGGVDGQVLVWDAMSNLVSMTSTAGVERYVYDASGQRVVRVAGTVATAYVGSTELTDADTAHAGTLTGMRYYTLGSTTVALRDASGFSYLIGDVQGSASVLIPAGATGDADPDTVVASRNAYTPYGVTRGDDNLVTDRGWLGQVEDASSGLTYLNARYYDSATARFISPDPLMDPTDPRTLDPYRYADNNPILYTDASGLSPACGGLTGAKQAACYAKYASAQKSGAAAKVKDTAVQKLNHNAAKNGSTKTHSTKDAPGATKKAKSPSRPHAAHPKGVRTAETSCSLNLRQCMGLDADGDGSSRLKDAGKKTWQAIRYLLNAAQPVNSVVGGIAHLDARLSGGSCEFDTDQLMWACYSAGAGYIPNSGGTTFGSVFVTKHSKSAVAALDSDPIQPRDTMPHEAKHSDLQATTGTVGTLAIMGVSVAGQWAESLLTGGNFNPHCNTVERMADYKAGGYYSC